MAYLLFLVILLGLTSYFLLSLSCYDSAIKLNKQHIYIYIYATVAQLVTALRYKLEGRGFDSWWCHWNFSLTAALWPWGRLSIQQNRATIKAAGAYHLHVPTDWKSQPQRPGILRASPGLYRDCLTFTCIHKHTHTHTHTHIYQGCKSLGSQVARTHSFERWILTNQYGNRCKSLFNNSNPCTFLNKLMWGRAHTSKFAPTVC